MKCKFNDIKLFEINILFSHTLHISWQNLFFKVVDAADVILEILDARDPLGSRCTQMEEAILESGTNKRLVLILNKIGLSSLIYSSLS